MKSNALNCDLTGSEHIIQLITELKGWRGRTLERLRALILNSEPDITEEWKWGTAVWTKYGSVCSAIPYKNSIRLYFFKGASLEDPNGLFNAEVNGWVSRAIDFRKGKDFDPTALKELVREAITFNLLGDLIIKNPITPQTRITEEV